MPMSTAKAAPWCQGRLLGDIVRQLPAGEVEIEYQAEENTLLVTSGSASYRLRTYAVEDFPRLPEVEGAPTSSLDAEPLLEAIACVARAAGRDESRPVLTGVFVHLGSGRLAMVATDSYRLSVKESDIAGDVPRAGGDRAGAGARRAAANRGRRRAGRARACSTTTLPSAPAACG